MTAHMLRLVVLAAVAAVALGAAGAAGTQATGTAGTGTAGPVLLQSGAGASPTPVDATGVVSRVDPQAGTITLQDGRVLHVTPRTTLWQPVPMTSVTPGASIHVRGGAPMDFRPGAPGPTSAVERDPMGVARRLP